MTGAKPPALRGEAAYQASIKEIAKRNEIARAAGARSRAEREAEAARQNAQLARREARDVPKQPRH